MLGKPIQDPIALRLVDIIQFVMPEHAKHTDLILAVFEWLCGRWLKWTIDPHDL